jgi:(4S)-4-hydroxy-5-phosphonooxypentane-2,3-dione isomerase
MITLIVNIKVKKEKVEEFIAASRENLANTRKEPGIALFEFFQDQDEPTHFALVEKYRNVEAQAAHRESAHYLRWKKVADAVTSEPRTRAQFSEIDPV